MGINTDQNWIDWFFPCPDKLGRWCHAILGCPWELLYADDLAMILESLDGMLDKFCLWKWSLEPKGLCVNIDKTKNMISGLQLDTLRDSGSHPCSVCRKGVASNSIYWNGCSRRVHKRCSNIKGKLTLEPTFWSSSCLGTAHPIDGGTCDNCGWP